MVTSAVTGCAMTISETTPAAVTRRLGNVDRGSKKPETTDETPVFAIWVIFAVLRPSRSTQDDVIYALKRC